MRFYPCCEHCKEDAIHDVPIDSHEIACNASGPCSTRPSEKSVWTENATLRATIERVKVLADQYAATAEVHAKVRDTIPHADANVRPHVRATALAAMAQHHADQLRAALATS